MKILVTGCAGFIGFHLSNYLLKQNLEVIGIDNLNEYYDVNLKKTRISLLKKFKNFKFNKFDLIKKNRLNEIIKKILKRYLCYYSSCWSSWSKIFNSKSTNLFYK